MDFNGNSNIIIHDNSSHSIRYIKKKDNKLKNLIKYIGTLSYSLHSDSYSFIVNTIISQMLSNKVSSIISSKLLYLCGNKLTPETINKISISELRSIGISNKKSEYIIDFSNFYISSSNYFNKINTLPDKDIIHELIKLRGIGIWSAKMYLIFVLDRLDVLPFEDGAFLQSFHWLYPHITLEKSSIQLYCNCWKPYSSIASRYLYKALDTGLIKSNIPI